MFSGYCEFTQIYSVYFFIKAQRFLDIVSSQIYSVYLFYKSTMFSGLWVHTNKKRPFTVPNDAFIITFMSNNYGV